MIDQSEDLNAAKDAYVRRDFARAKVLLDGIIERAPNSVDGLSARYLRARGYEDGHFVGGVNLDKALDDFDAVSEEPAICGSDGLVGSARVLFEKNEFANREKIIRLCERALTIDANVKAMMILGFVHERVLNDGAGARLWYLRAYKSGLPWGMRYFARSHARDGHRVRAFLSHLVASLSSPVLVLRYGARSPFH